MSDDSRESTYEVDVSASRIRMQTRATGLLARFAHDLEIEAPDLDADVSVQGDRWSATLRFPVARLRVVGVVRKGQVDETVLSANDKDEIRQRMDEQVFGGTATVVVRAEGAKASSGAAMVELGKGTQKVPLRHDIAEGDDGANRIEGRCALSLRSLGVKEIKGPLGAFKVHDGVDVIYSVLLRPTADG
jgi:hypothetical protein